jgi:signal transduction histidine kinase
VAYAIDGDPARVSAGVAVCAYRIVQEALSNVVRHCGAVPTRVHLRVSDSSLDLAVENAAPQRVLPQAPTGQGRGLAGMRERVAVFDGKLETRSLPDGGFTVHATLPLGRQ